MRQLTGTPDLGSGVPMRELRAAARTSSPKEFEDRHGSAFLLLTAADLSLARGPGSTEVRLVEDGNAPGDSTAGLSLVVYPVKQSGRSMGHLLTIGRAPNNDVVIPDVSISRFHAFAKPEGDGWKIQDAGSTNGTLVNGRNVSQQGHGDPTALEPGDDVRLGQVELTFLDCEALLSYLTKLER